MNGKIFERNQKTKNKLVGLLTILMLFVLIFGITSCCNSGIDDAKRTMPVEDETGFFSKQVVSVPEGTIVSKNWSGKTGYVPTSGRHQEEFKTNPTNGSPYVISMIDFTLNSSNVTSITNYKTNNNYYFGMQVRSVKDSGNAQKMDAYQVISSLPNPYYDIEPNWLESSYNNEVEAIATGTVTAKTYWMNAYWDDYRTYTDGAGGFKVTTEMSTKNILTGEYNEKLNTQITEVAIYYGKNPGVQ